MYYNSRTDSWLCLMGVQGTSALAGVLGHLSCLKAGNPIIAPGGRYCALASQNACARQSISTRNPLSQCAVCSDNQVQSMDEALERRENHDLKYKKRCKIHHAPGLRPFLLHISACCNEKCRRL
jgi:hypothetical protein